MAERLVQHRHCKVCGKAVAPSDQTCSEECSSTWQAQQRKKKQTLYFFYISIVVLIIAFILEFYGGG